MAALNSFNKNKFSKPFDSKYSSEETINQTALNMGAIHYLHVGKILESMTLARVEDNAGDFARLLKSLFAISQTKINDLIDVKKIKSLLNNLQINLVNYDYYKHCLYHGDGNENALQPFRFESFNIWRLCEDLFDQIYFAMDKKGMILPDKANDNFGKYLTEFGVSSGDLFNENNNK